MFKTLIPFLSALVWLGLFCSCSKNSGSIPTRDPDLSLEGGACEDNTNCSDGLVCEAGTCIKQVVAIAGTENAACLPDHTCTEGLECKSDVCVKSESDESKGISAGFAHVCSIHKSGLLYCWGDNLYGQLGIGNTSTQTEPQPVGSDKWLAVSAGDAFTCGIKEADNKLYCWGENNYGQLGLGDSSLASYSTPQLVGSDKWKSVSAGSTHTCGIMEGDKLYCWGHNGFGQIGTGVKQTPLRSPQAVGDEKWKMVSAGTNHTCGIKGDDIIYCWGIDSFNSLGVGGDNCGIHMWTYFPLPVRGSECICKSNDVGVSCLPQTDYAKWISVSAGQNYTCGVSRDDHKLYCWGEDLYGGLGLGVHKNDFNHPRAVGDDKWASVNVASTGNHTCGIKEDDGKLYCWGWNDKGQLGIGNTVNQNTPQAVGNEKWKSVSGGFEYTCGIRDADSKVYCW